MKRMLPLKSRRPHLYGTRRLEAGDEYEAPIEEAIALVASRKADFAKGKKPTFETKVAAAKPAPEPAVPRHDEPEPAVPQHEPAPRPMPMTMPRRLEPMPDEPAETQASIDALRLQATQLGINVDGRWGAARLQHEIEQAKNR